MPIDHWMMFGTFAEQRHFAYPTKDTYNGAIINGNMAAHAPDGLAVFLLEKTSNLPYIIDPLTHAFQHDPEMICTGDGEPKSSIKALGDAYGPPIEPIVGTRPLLPRDFQDEKALGRFVKRCLQFQNDILANAMASSDAMKYLTVTKAELQPYALVAPYFYMTETTYRQWLPICRAAARLAKAEYPDANLFGSVVVSQGVILDEGVRSKIAEAFLSEDLSGFLVWVDNLDEQQAGGAELRGLLGLTRSLRDGGRREVINLHGGYFSILAAGNLGKSAMSGITHGPEFGEFRSVVPVGGGIPIARYYIPQLHARIRYRDAVRFLNAKGWLKNAAVFHKNVCNCDECRATLEGDVANFTKFGVGKVRTVKRGNGLVRIEYPITETKLHCLRHYLQNKRLEYQFASTASASQIREDLARGRDEFEEIVGLDGVSHLELWPDILDKQ